MEKTLRDGLIAEYLFEGNAEDSSGGGCHGKVAGATLTEDRFGNPDSAYLFDGNDDYMVLDPAPRLSAEAFSLSVWVRYSRNANLRWWNNAIVSQDGHKSRRVFQLSTMDKRITWHRFGGKEVALTDDLLTEKWIHIAMLFDGAVHRMYANGVCVSEQEGTLVPDHDEPIYIGRKATDEPYFFFRGAIDDIRMYDRALNADEVAALYTENGWARKEAVFALQQAKLHSEPVDIKHKRTPNHKLHVENTSMSLSTFVNCTAGQARFHDVTLPESRITYTDFNNSLIENCNLSHAHISQTKMNRSFITDCDLTGVAIDRCKLSGMTIDGISVEDLLQVYRDRKPVGM